MAQLKVVVAALAWAGAAAQVPVVLEQTTSATDSPASVAPDASPGPLGPIVSKSGWTTGTWTTGYWDCCKPSCSWPGKGNVNKPALACEAGTDKRLQDPNVKSVCGGGTAASCSDNQPFVVAGNLTMGFTAAAVGGGHGLNGDENCGQCFELRFTSQVHPGGNWGGSHPGLVGKSMIVQVTNIGYDVTGDHSFDIQIPAAGQGIFRDGCVKDYGHGFTVSDFDCGKNYGGCDNISGCAKLPAVLRPGCEWRYNWYHWNQGGGKTNNPYVDFRRVKCPRQLIDISGTIPNDDDMQPMADVVDYSAATSGAVTSSADHLTALII